MRLGQSRRGHDHGTTMRLGRRRSTPLESSGPRRARPPYITCSSCATDGALRVLRVAPDFREGLRDIARRAAHAPHAPHATRTRRRTQSHAHRTRLPSPRATRTWNPYFCSKSVEYGPNPSAMPESTLQRAIHYP